MNSEGRTIDRARVQRLTEAGDWLLRLQAPGRTEAEYDEWLRWCDADPENFAAFETVQRRWNDLDALKSCAEPAAAPVLRAGRFVRHWALAAAVAVVALMAGIGWYVRQPEAPARAARPQFANRAATLPDGSKMILGAQSLVNTDFTGTTRRIDMSSGEAYFDVKHDSARPFVVQAGVVSVTAIGTAFDVRRNHDKVTVTVEDGTVEVRGSHDDKRAVWRAEAGYQLVYSIQKRTASLASVDPLMALSWRNGELAYIHEPLGSVVEDLNRYSARKIRIEDAEIARLPFTGTAFAPSLEGWLAAVEQAYPIEVRELPTGEIVLAPRK